MTGGVKHVSNYFKKNGRVMEGPATAIGLVSDSDLVDLDLRTMKVT